MARIAGVNIPTNKRIVIALTYIKGIGNHTSEKICKSLKISSSKRVFDLTEDEIIQIRQLIETYDVEGALITKVNSNIDNKKKIKCYQGLRHIARLPVRGQNTHSNARTRKGKAVTIAGKKK